MRWDEHFARAGDLLAMSLIALSVGWCAMEDLLISSFLGKNLWFLNIWRLAEIIL